MNSPKRMVPLVTLVAAVVFGDVAGAGSRPVVVRVESGGFHWLDAGIGAAVMLAAVLLALAIVATRRAGLLGSVRSIRREEP